MLTFFYPPDLSAGSFRAAALVSALSDCSSGDVQIDVLTTQPNRYHHISNETHALEVYDGLRIRRVQLPSHKGGFLDQARSFSTFAVRAARFAQKERYDLVVATSSRLMTAVLGAWIAWQRGTRLYLDVRDIFVENLGELFSSSIARPLGVIFGALERWAVRRADKTNLVSAGFLGYFQPRYRDMRFSIFPNGVDAEFLDFAPGASRSAEDGRPLLVLYAGNMGDGQGLHLILPELARRLQGRVQFRLVGAGGRLDVLRDALAKQAIDNVELLAPVARERLLGHYQEADILFVHLNDFKAFRRVLPSKLFEYAATGKPIWAGVAGYAEEFVETEIPNAAIFQPCDVDDAIRSFERLHIAHTSRAQFVERYARRKIMSEMATDVLSVLKDRP